MGRSVNLPASSLVSGNTSILMSMSFDEFASFASNLEHWIFSSTNILGFRYTCGFSYLRLGAHDGSN